MGTGDWNDGMNRVGREGPRRECLARLLPGTVLDRWTPLAERAAITDRAARYAAHRAALGETL
jgi:N,N'-diacetylchitobiose phosphorylase